MECYVTLLPGVNEMQVRIDKDIVFGAGEQRLRLAVDTYNLFNADTYTSLRNNSSDTRDENFGQPLAIVAPRRAMVGIRLEF